LSLQTGNLDRQDLVGQYARESVENAWHSGVISAEGDTLSWKNDAGVSWKLTLRLTEGRLLTDEASPYHAEDGGDAFTIVLKQDGDGAPIPAVDGFRFLNDFYRRK